MQIFLQRAVLVIIGKAKASPISRNTVEQGAVILMKQYVIDQLSELDYHKLRNYLEENLEQTFMEGLFWVNLPEELYSEIQYQHDQCQPFYFAINLSRNQISFEWLIRSRQTLHCPCISYADARQRDHIIRYADELMERLHICTR